MDISEYRKSVGLSQAAFAAALTAAGSPATQSLISQWESGDVNVPAERVAVVERVTGGVVSRHDLRPDLFGTPEGQDDPDAGRIVPVESA